MGMGFVIDQLKVRRGAKAGDLVHMCSNAWSQVAASARGYALNSTLTELATKCTGSHINVTHNRQPSTASYGTF